MDFLVLDGVQNQQPVGGAPLDGGEGGVAARSGARGAARSLPEGIGARIAAPLVGQRPVIFAPTRRRVNLGGFRRGRLGARDVPVPGAAWAVPDWRGGRGGPTGGGDASIPASSRVRLVAYGERDRAAGSGRHHGPASMSHPRRSHRVRPRRNGHQTTRRLGRRLGRRRLDVPARRGCTRTPAPRRARESPARRRGDRRAA